jgi:predicted HicB family RNase H-like nuclease
MTEMTKTIYYFKPELNKELEILKGTQNGLKELKKIQYNSDAQVNLQDLTAQTQGNFLECCSY